MLGQVIPPVDVQVLISQICDYIVLHGEKDSVDVIQLLKWGDYPSLSHWACWNLMGPYKREAGNRVLGREGWKMPTTGSQVRGRQTLETVKDKKSFYFPPSR